VVGSEFPRSGGIPELSAIAANNRRRLESTEPGKEDKKKVLEWVKNNYPSAGVPWYFHDRLKVSGSVIADVLATVNRKSSPGSPYFHFAPSKGQFIDHNAEEIVRLVQYRIKEYAETPNEEFRRMSATQLVERNLTDVVKVHVKREPTKREKLLEGRPRIIMVESIVSEVLQKLIFGPQMKLEIANWETTPSNPGFGLATDDQAAALYASVGGAKNLYDSDVSGFDWNMNRWMFDLFVEAHLYNNNVEEGTMYANACRNVIHVLSNSIYLTSMGGLYELEDEGVMNSGAAITSWFNSLIRAGIGILAGHNLIITMGDDAVHDEIDDPIGKYAKLGLRLKNFTKCPENSFNFCSSDIYRTHAVPTGIWKSTLNLLYKPYDETEFNDFVHVMRHSPSLPKVIEMLHEIGYIRQD